MFLPRYIIKHLERTHCPFCDEAMSEEGVVSIGARRTESSEDLVYLYLDHQCQNCDELATATFKSIKFEDFILEAFEMIHNPEEELKKKLDKDGTTEAYKKNTDLSKRAKKKKPSPKQKKESKSKISDKEVNDFLNELNKAEAYVDVLRYIGLTDDQIEEG